MALTENQEKQLKKMPKIETKIRKSKDGKYIINKTVITHIRPVEYYEAIMKDEPARKKEEDAVEDEEFFEKEGKDLAEQE